MKPFRNDIETLEQNGITRIAFTRIDDPSVIPLWFGEGDAVTPDFIRQAVKDSLDAGETFYNHTRGRADLRSAIKVYLDELYERDIHPDRITVPGSAMLGITMAAQTALNSGDHALIVGPVWPNIENSYRSTGADVSYVRQRQTAEGWQLSCEEIMAAAKTHTRSIFVNSPCNPTGWMMPQDEQQKLLEFCRERKILLIADEVYHRTVFGAKKAPSFLEIAEDDDPVVVVNSFSKAWAMTGWRIGWVVAPKRHAELWATLSECYNTGSTVFTQPGAIAALTQGEEFVAQLQNQYAGGRKIVEELFGQHELLDLTMPEGAFYVFPRVKGLKDSFEFVSRVLEEENVGLAPGYTFGPGNEGFFRLCFAQSHDRLREGLNGVLRYLERHGDSFG